MYIFKTKRNYNSDTIVHIYYQLIIMKRELVSQNIHEAHLNDMKHNAYYNATPIYETNDLVFIRIRIELMFRFRMFTFLL